MYCLETSAASSFGNRILLDPAGGWWKIIRKQPTDHSFSFPRLVVFCLLLLLSCFFGCLFFFFFANKHETRRKKINKRYEEVDGVRKEKERLTNDHPTPPSTSSSLLLSVVFFHYWLTSSLVLSASKLGSCYQPIYNLWRQHVFDNSFLLYNAASKG